MSSSGGEDEATLVLVVRHGVSCANVLAALSKILDETDRRRLPVLRESAKLTPFGKRQAMSTYLGGCILNLAKQFAFEEPISAIVSSEMKRAKQTAKGIYQRICDTDRRCAPHIFRDVVPYEWATETSEPEPFPETGPNLKKAIEWTVDEMDQHLGPRDRERPTRVAVLVSHGGIMKRDLNLDEPPKNTQVVPILFVKHSDGRTDMEKLYPQPEDGDFSSCSGTSSFDILKKDVNDVPLSSVVAHHGVFEEQITSCFPDVDRLLIRALQKKLHQLALGRRQTQ